MSRVLYRRFRGVARHRLDAPRRAAVAPMPHAPRRRVGLSAGRRNPLGDATASAARDRIRAPAVMIKVTSRPRLGSWAPMPSASFWSSMLPSTLTPGAIRSSGSPTHSDALTMPPPIASAVAPNLPPSGGRASRALGPGFCPPVRSTRCSSQQRSARTATEQEPCLGPGHAVFGHDAAQPPRCGHVVAFGRGQSALVLAGGCRRAARLGVAAALKRRSVSKWGVLVRHEDDKPIP